MHPDVAGQIERLAALKESGALTETEFQEAKALLLGEQAPPIAQPAPAEPALPSAQSAQPANVTNTAADALAGSTAHVEAPPIRSSTWPATAVDNPLSSDRDELRRAGLRFTRYPVWLVVVLSVVTLGIFAMFWVQHWHGIMPKRRTDDPSTARAIGFMFIPLFNLYWMFESRLRLCTRLNEEFSAAQLPLRAPNQLVLWWTITGMIPYVGFLSLPIMGAIAAGTLQSQVNALATFDDEWYRTQSAADQQSGVGYAIG
jgi:hypothetical protein